MEPRLKSIDELPASPIYKLIMDPQILIAAGTYGSVMNYRLSQENVNTF